MDVSVFVLVYSDFCAFLDSFRVFKNVAKAMARADHILLGKRKGNTENIKVDFISLS